MRFSPIAISRYRFTLTAQAPFTLRGHPGAMLRGAWGHALRALACSTGQPQCTGCPVRTNCRYAALFEPLPDHHRSVPPPYTFQVPLAAPENLSPGEGFQFDMVLFGDARNEIALVAQAWQQAARRGLGEQQTPMCLTSVTQHTKERAEVTLWEAPHGLVASVQPPRIPAHDAELSLADALPPVALKGVEITFLSPLRLQVDGRVISAQQLTAERFLANLWRRIQLYNRYYLGLPQAEKPPMTGILLQPQGVRRQQWQRHSQRQSKTMRLDGLLGSVTLHGDLTDWWPWLWLGQYTHLGKNTAFGLGQYQLKVL